MNWQRILHFARGACKGPSTPRSLGHAGRGPGHPSQAQRVVYAVVGSENTDAIRVYDWPLGEVTPESLAQEFHEAYERLAPDHGYKTREASAVPWADVPEGNKGLMIATAAAVLGAPVSGQLPPSEMGPTKG